MNDLDKHTPMMRQYFEIKQQYPDTLVFYRLGDFYELFYDDAKIVSNLLDITLTRRGTGPDGSPIPMAGIPYHASDSYIARLIKLGRSIVICEQVGERTKQAKSSMMQRKVSRIITPGTVTDEGIVQERQDNLIAAIYEDKIKFGFATLNLSSGKFTTTELANISDLSLYLDKVAPAELLYPERFSQLDLLKDIDCRKALPSWNYDQQSAYQGLCQQFKTKSLIGFGIEKLNAAICAAGALLEYVKSTQNVTLEHITAISKDESSSIVLLDRCAQKNLELLTNLSGNNQGSLLAVIDETKTPMGSRLLRNLIVNPLRNNSEVNNRLDLVEALSYFPYVENLREQLDLIGDVERIVARIGLHSAKPRDLSKLRDGLALLPTIKHLLQSDWSNENSCLQEPYTTIYVDDATLTKLNNHEQYVHILCMQQKAHEQNHVARNSSNTNSSSNETFNTLQDNTEESRDSTNIDNQIAQVASLHEITVTKGQYLSSLLREKASLLPDLDNVVDLLHRAILEEPSTFLRDGNVIAHNFNSELDELRSLQNGAEEILQKIEEREKEATGINNLKVRYNGANGFYIEVSKSNIEKVPNEYIRRQTLKNCERYITPELKAIEEKTISAQTRALQLEKEIFEQIQEELIKQLSSLSSFAHNIALLDVVCGLAKVALKRHYVRPKLVEESYIKIVAGRHPVVEALSDSPFISNGVELNEQQNIAVISGPNMGGKSTFMRQTALIAILARMGSFVPASEAIIGDIDRIFTRIGASDDLASGRSTFMVEMEETATILNNATEKSLVIMDEVGRGTSGAEGAAIAEAIVQYLVKETKPKTLFATHYAEVTALIENYKNAYNLCFNAKEHQGKIVFLYHAEKGRQSRSFGIEVAQLAGVPSKITRQALKFYHARTQELQSVNLFTPPLLSSLGELSSENNTEISATQNISNQTNHESEQNNSNAELIEYLQHELLTARQQITLQQDSIKELEEVRSNYQTSLDLVNSLMQINVDNLTPIQALNILGELKNKLK